MINPREKKIYTKQVAYYLRQQGFKIIRVEPNENKPEFDAYIFEASPAFYNALAKYKR